MWNLLLIHAEIHCVYAVSEPHEWCPDARRAVYVLKDMFLRREVKVSHWCMQTNRSLYAVKHVTALFNKH
jgi:hypothetical protein